MTSLRQLLSGLAVAIAVTPVLSAQNATGILTGRAGNQYAKHYADYAVVLRNVSTGQMAGSASIDRFGQFAFTRVPLDERYLVELVTKDNARVCTEGPYSLSARGASVHTDVVIECGKVPMVLWLAAIAGGTASAVGVTTASGSR